MSGLRAVLRLAARDARRHRGRSLLLALMVFAPVLVATAGAVLLRSANLEPRDDVALRLGGDRVQARVEGLPFAAPVAQDAGGSALESAPPGTPRRTRAETTRALTEMLAGDADSVVPVATSLRRFVAAGDRRTLTGLLEVDLGALGDGGPVRLVDGRAPRTPTEVAVSRALASGLRVGVGGTVRLTERNTGTVRPGTYTVVGLVDGAIARGPVVLGAPGSLLDAAAMESSGTYGRDGLLWYVVGPDAVTWPQVRRANDFGAPVTSRRLVVDPPAGMTPAGTSTAFRLDTGPTTGVLVFLALLQVSLLAGPAVAVGARRNERLLATVAATGGSPAHLRRVVLAGAGAVGAVASVCGAVAGLGLGVLAVRTAGHWGGPPMPRVDWSPLDAVLLVAAGTGTALAAAVLPARRVARLDVVATLTGRRPLDRPRLRPGLTGALVVVAGVALLLYSALRSNGMPWRASRFGGAVGLAVVEVGLVLAAPAVVALVARLGGRAPLATRFALRDAARRRSRTAPALAAVLTATAAGVFVLALVDAQADALRRTYRADVPVGVVTVQLQDGRSQGIAAPAATSAVRDVLPDASTTVLRAPAPSDGGFTPMIVEQVMPSCDTPTRVGCIVYGYNAYVVDPAGAAVLAPPDAAVAASRALTAGKVVVWSERLVAADGTVAVKVPAPETEQLAVGGGVVEAGVRLVRLPAVAVAASQPLASVLVPDALAGRLGVDLEPFSVLARTSGHISRQSVVAVQEAVEPLGQNVAVWREDGPDGPGTGRLPLAVLVGALLVAVAGTASAVGLAAADARPDLGTLAAVGADPSLRRRIGAAQAAAVAVPAAVIGVVAGLAGAWLLLRLDRTRWFDPDQADRFVLPVGPTALFLVGVPLVAVLLGWVSVRSRLPVVRRPG